MTKDGWILGKGDGAMNIAESVCRVASQYPDRTALIGPDRSLTYGELEATTGCLAGALLAAGLLAGDRVALFLPNSTAFAVAYLAVLRAGCVAVSITPSARETELRHMLSDSGTRLAITSPELAAEIEPLRPELPALERVVVGWAEIDRLVESAIPVAPAQVSSGHPAALLYTSGTTGRPKGAELSHSATVLNVMAAQLCTRTRAADRLLCFLPLSHCFGQNFILNNALMAGATLEIHARFDPAEVWERVNAGGITMIFGVPTAFRALLATCPERSRFPSLRYLFNGADTAPEALSRGWEDATGLTLYQGYGLTEAGPFVSYNHLQRYKHGGLGRPVPGVIMQAVDEAGQPLPPGEPGEMRVRARSLMTCYWKNPEATNQAIRDGWLYTGDVGVMDEEGDFFLVDRVKDLINMSGYKIYPREVEAVLAAYPGVADCAIIGQLDPYKGEIAKAMIAWQAGVEPNLEQVREWLSQRVAGYKVPSLFESIDSIPRGPTGKILRRQLQDLRLR